MTENSNNDEVELDLGDIDLEEIERINNERLKKLNFEEHLNELEEIYQENCYKKEEILERYCDRAKILYKSNRLEDAIKLLKVGLNYYPNEPQLICFMGFACLSNESWEAKTYFQRALEIDPKYPLAHYGLGFMELKLAQNSEAAQRRYNLLMQLDPNLASHLKGQINKFLIKRK